MLLNIQETMRRMVQLIESIPLHLSLPIIRLDDALGQSWALPLQACSNYTVLKTAHSFRGLLTAVGIQKYPPGSGFPSQPPRVASGPIGYVRPLDGSVAEHHRHAQMVSRYEAGCSYSASDAHCGYSGPRVLLVHRMLRTNLKHSARRWYDGEIMVLVLP